jgi:endo-1,4-beta-xylanase
MRRLGELGLYVHITELDVRLPTDPPEQLYERQAEVYRDLMTVCLSADRCTAFVMWGFTDRHSWIPSHFPGEGAALIFDHDYRPKRAYDALGEVLMTNAAVQGGENPGELPELPGPESFGAECDCLP